IWMTRALPLMSGKGRALKVVDTHDVFSTREKKVVHFGVDGWHVSPKEEARRLRRADLILAIQDEEREELQKLVPDMPVIAAGVDFDVADATSTPSGRRILYVASDNPMNRKGVEDFLRFAWPKIVREVPDAELLVAGKIGQTITRSIPGVVLLGAVDDLG